METDGSRLLSESSGSAVSLQDQRNPNPTATGPVPLYPPLDDYETESVVQLSGSTVDQQETAQGVSLKSRNSSSIRTTTVADDQAALIRKERPKSLGDHGNDESWDNRGRKSGLAAIRKKGVQHFGGELEKIKSTFAVRVPRTGIICYL